MMKNARLAKKKAELWSLKTELWEVEREIDTIVLEGGRVSLTDPLTQKARGIRTKIHKLVMSGI